MEQRFRKKRNNGLTIQFNLTFGLQIKRDDQGRSLENQVTEVSVGEKI